MEFKRLSHYEIHNKLGEGGMGAVYAATDTRLNRRVALKFLVTGLVSSPDARARFSREAMAVSSLSHPNIGVLFDFEETPEALFLVLEYLPGGTLQDKLRGLRGPGFRLPIETAVRWARQIAEGLAHAHRKGVIHRDIKPANILFDGEDRLKIMDFGLAKIREGIELTGTGTSMGTPAYMAPEQALGRGGVDRRADVFSLGVLLYQMVSGELPFRADTQFGTLHKVLHDAPVPPSTLRRDLPQELERIIDRCLAKKPEARYQRMEELVADLAPLDAGPESPAPSLATVTMGAVSPGLDTAAPTQLDTASLEAPASPPPAKPWRKKTLRVAMIAVIAAALLATLRTFIPFGGGAPDQRKLAVLMFENIGGDASQQAFCDGLTFSLTSAVTQLGQADRSLWVVPATEVRRDEIRSVTAARKTLGVNLALTGSVQRSAERVKVNVNLVDAVERLQLASRVLESSLAELPDLENRILGEVVRMLELEIAGEAPAVKPGTENAHAYEKYLTGLGYLQRFDKPGNLDRAATAFEAALARDPEFAPARAGLGRSYLLRHTLTNESQWLARAQEENRRAIALDDTLAAAHINLCILNTRTGRFEEAVREGKRALELDPLNSEAYRSLGNAYSAAGRETEAEATFLQAISLKPGSWVAYSNLGVFYVTHSRFGEANAAFAKVIELVPDNESGYRNMAAVQQITGRNEEAETMLETAVSIKPTGDNLSNLGTLFFAMERYPEAVRSYERAVEMTPESPIIWGNLADAYRTVPSLAAKAPETYRRAVTIAERQLVINRRNAELLTGLAVYTAKLGDTAKSLDYLARARALQGDNVQLTFQSAVVYEAAGRRADALAALREAVEGGYPASEAVREPELEALTRDPEFQEMLPQ